MSQLAADLSKYKKQRNLVVKLNMKQKKEYFENLNVATNSKPFDNCKPYFSNKHAKGDSNIMLIEKDEILLKNKKIADVLNSYFDSVTDSIYFLGSLKVIIKILMHSKTFWKYSTITQV